VREQRQDNEALMAELSEARDRLDRSVQRLSAVAPASGAARRLSPGFVDWPVQGRVAARFGRETSSRFGTNIVRNGVEIDAPADAAVRAIQTGTVAFADVFPGFGRVVILDHGGKDYSLYGHLASIGVNKGQDVPAGQTVGTVGTAPTGDASLYFELRIDGRPVDPVQWLKR
jgi:septal ring factor EnvC (AmiA/AmiB activator)